MTELPSITGADAKDADLPALAPRLWNWLCDEALPLWWRVGADRDHGGFHEAIDQDGRPFAAPRRGRVLPRQIYAYATAGALGWPGPTAAAVDHGLAFLLENFQRPDGLFRTCVEIDGRVRDDHAVLYDQAFALLGLYAAYRLEPRPALRDAAEALLTRIREHFGHPGGGFREDDATPFQSNAQMHTFEACIAWDSVAGGAFGETADALAQLCLTRLIDPERGVIDEIYDADWTADGPGGVRRIEPGHQFEWAWLLGQWGEARGVNVRAPITRLFAIGEAAVHKTEGVAPAAITIDGVIADPLARLWPQTERLRIAAYLARATGETDGVYERAAADAARAVLNYLDTPVRGLWRDKRLADGSFLPEPAPASSLYHLIGAIAVLKQLVIDPAPTAPTKPPRIS